MHLLFKISDFQLKQAPQLELGESAPSKGFCSNFEENGCISSSRDINPVIFSASIKVGTRGNFSTLKIYLIYYCILTNTNVSVLIYVFIFIYYDLPEHK